MKDQVISLARLLLAKKLAFCIYRFPDDDVFRIAIKESLLPHKKDISFRISPFVPMSAAQEIILGVVKKEFLGDNLLAHINSLPDGSMDGVLLAEETSKEDYFKRIKAFLSEIRSEKLDKAILSRVFHVQKPEGFDPVDCFEQLSNDYPSTFVHLSLLPESGIWIGATPELLLKKTGAEYETMALAGTQAINSDHDYHWRNKEMQEHLMVGRHIEDIFKKNHLVIRGKDGPKTIESGKVAHLRTDYIFKETTHVPLEILLSELHPTPAVGGLPVDKGIECILQHEGYDRKYYCGFIGETDFSEMARLYINLRCMQIGKESIAIFVGGGITAASDLQEEWEETIMKSKTMLEKINPVKELH